MSDRRPERPNPEIRREQAKLEITRATREISGYIDGAPAGSGIRHAFYDHLALQRALLAKEEHDQRSSDMSRLRPSSDKTSYTTGPFGHDHDLPATHQRTRYDDDIDLVKRAMMDREGEVAGYPDAHERLEGQIDRLNTSHRDLGKGRKDTVQVLKGLGKQAFHERRQQDVSTSSTTPAPVPQREFPYTKRPQRQEPAHPIPEDQTTPELSGSDFSFPSTSLSASEILGRYGSGTSATPSARSEQPQSPHASNEESQSGDPIVLSDFFLNRLGRLLQEPTTPPKREDPPVRRTPSTPARRSSPPERPRKTPEQLEREERERSQKKAERHQESESHRQRGVFFGNAGLYQDAIKEFDESIRSDRENTSAYYGKGVALQLSGRSADAIPLYDRALSLNPEHIPSLINKGAALVEQGNYQGGIALYNQALEIDPLCKSAEDNRRTAEKLEKKENKRKR